MTLPRRGLVALALACAAVLIPASTAHSTAVGVTTTGELRITEGNDWNAAQQQANCVVVEYAFDPFAPNAGFPAHQWRVTESCSTVFFYAGACKDAGTGGRIVCDASMVSTIRFDGGGLGDTVSIRDDGRPGVTATLVGGTGNDDLTAGENDAVIEGGSGDDKINKGADYPVFGSVGGRDTIDGGDGNDQIVASRDPDRVNGGPGNDDIRDAGSAGNVLHGDAGNDIVVGGGDVHGDDGDDEVSGSTGNDTVSGGRGRDRIFGSTGDDRIEARDGEADGINCGAHRDIAVADAGDTFDTENPPSCETIERPAPPAPPPPPPPAPPIVPGDTTAPVVTLNGFASKGVVRRGALSVLGSCDESCTMWVAASMRAGGKTIRMRTVVGAMPTPGVATFTLRFLPSELRRMRPAVRGKRSVWVTLTVVAVDAAGNRTAFNRGFRVND